MAKVAGLDATRVQDIEAELGTFVHGSAPALSTLMEPLQELLGTEKTAAHALYPRGDRLGIEYLFGARFPALRFQPILDQWFREHPINFGCFNAIRPEPWQRNAALTLKDLMRRGVLPADGPSATPLGRDIWPRFGLDKRDQLRVLVCEGPSLLALVAAYQPAPFDVRQKRLLGAVVRPLRRRLRLERQVGQMARTHAALEIALEAIGRAAFVVGPTGDIQCANTAARAMLDRQRASLTRALRDAALRRPAEHTFELTRFRVNGAPDGYLALVKSGAREGKLSSRIAWAATRWGLSPRQREVLELLARGLSNRTIAASFAVSERAVELHVSAIFDRAGVCSRAALAAELLWRD